MLSSLGITQGSQDQAATFVIDLNGNLCLAERRSVHVCCAGGHDVPSASEVTFGISDKNLAVEWITNQSTGYCLEPLIVGRNDIPSSALLCVTEVKVFRRFDIAFATRRLWKKMTQRRGVAGTQSV